MKIIRTDRVDEDMTKQKYCEHPHRFVDRQEEYTQLNVNPQDLG